ncbi:MAG: 4Fe-4S binding protein [Acutalibacteraceae bacterium]
MYPLRYVQNCLHQPDGVHGTYTLEETGGKAVCIYCGQCANVCPVDSITERDESAQVKKAIADPEKIVVVSTSPGSPCCSGRGIRYGTGCLCGRKNGSPAAGTGS